MATSATARETFFALRREIAKIEGSFADTLDLAEADAAAGVILRRDGNAPRRAPGAGGFLPTGAEAFDDALGGGIPLAALTEIHGAEMRDAGAVTGFAFALASLALRSAVEGSPILWIAVSDSHREAGHPYAPGHAGGFGIAPENMLVCEVGKVAQALWVAEEAARLEALAAVLVEVSSHPRMLDLTATRRLHFRARDTRRPVFLLRQSAVAEPTAAPVRFSVSPAPAGLRRTVAGPLQGSIGPPAFSVVIDKGRGARPERFELEWNCHERSLRRRTPEDSGALVALSPDRRDMASKTGAILALHAGVAEDAAGRQPSRPERAADRLRRRAG